MAKKTKVLHIHRDCALARLMQWGNDPLIAECTVDGERHVASTPISCSYFKPREGEEKIEHFRNRLGITDKYID